MDDKVKIRCPACTRMFREKVSRVRDGFQVNCLNCNNSHIAGVAERIDFLHFVFSGAASRRHDFRVFAKPGTYQQISFYPLCVLLGEMSYSIYLYHVPFGYYFSSNRTQMTSMTTTRIVCLIALAALCYASLMLFERPARAAIRRAAASCASYWTVLFRPSPQTS